MLTCDSSQIIFLCIELKHFQHHLLKRFSSHQWVILVPLPKVSWLWGRGCASALCLLFCRPPRPPSRNTTSPSPLLCFSNVVLALLSPLNFHKNFRISFSLSSQRVCWKFGWHFIGTIAQCRANGHLNASSLLIHDYGISLHVFVSSLIPLNNAYGFQGKNLAHL